MMTAKDDPFAIFDNEPLKPAAETNKTDKLQVANGGTGELTHTCAACKGRGKFVSYTGRIVGNCFKCGGAGKVSGGKAAAAKGIETKKRNAAEWALTHRAELAYIAERAPRSNFMAAMQSSWQAYGKLTDNQLAAVRKDMAEEPARIAAAVEKRNAENASKSGEVSLERIEELFNTAKESGLKKPKFRTEHLDLNPAPATGRNAGALYVTKDGVYLGKIVGGTFMATREAPAETLAHLQEVAKDPLAIGVAYGKLTGKCCACGRELTDPVSVENGIGPICEGNWGL